MPRLVRRALAPLACLVLLVTAALSGVRWTQDASSVELVIDEVGGSVSVLYGRGGNIAFSDGPDGLLVVDSQFDWLAPKIVEELAERTERSPAWLVNTHFHGDHVGGNAKVGESGVIVAHANTRRRMLEGLQGGGRTGPPAESAALPDLTLEEGLTLHFNGEEVELLHVPTSHTDTDVIVWFKGSKVIHLGDLFFAGKFPFVDLASGGDVDGLIGSIQSLLERMPSDIRIVPGHGSVCGVGELGRYLEMLLETRTRVSEALAAGRSAEEMREMELLGDLAPEWGDGFISADAWIETLANALAGS